MQSGCKVRTLVAAFAIAVIAGMGVILLCTLMPRGQRFSYGLDRPLLQDAEPLFIDAQTGLQFVPPQDWSMQARSLDAPKHRPERLLVKYKRVVPELTEAWLRIRVKDVPESQTAAEFLRQRKPKEPDLKPTKEIDDKLTIGGQPAARMVFTGPFDPDGRGPHDYTCEILVVRRGPQVFEFAGTYLTSDAQAREQIQTAFKTIAFGK